ncbi:MAG TPA: DUF2460 domain-containing protein [Rickettsiales bacterium]|nr:DUF2460 domain-containing protein [Rickettsiales bacterium]
MSFLEIRFPESISFNSSSMLEFNTTIITTKNGSEARNINWSKNKMKFNIVNGIKTKTELDEIFTFFRNVKGCGYGFRFKDWTDYSATSQELGVGDGSTVEFQLLKTYTVSGNIYTRKITKPVISTITLYLDDVESEDFSIDLTTGIITFNTAPSTDVVITADFEFDVPVRFNSDILEITLETINTGKIRELELLEIG